MKCPRLLTLVGLTLLFACPGANAASPCAPVEHETIVCKDGQHNLRVIQGSVSPSKRYAIAWGIEGGDPAVDDLVEDPLQEDQPQERSYSTDNRDHVWNYLVRLADGKILARLDGRHFGDREHYNHYQHKVSWSPDERYLAQVTDWRFGSSFASAYRIGADGRIAGPLQIIPPVHAAASRQLKSATDRTYTENAPAAIEVKSLVNDGTLKLGAGFAQPKEEGFSFEVAMKLAVAGKRLTAGVRSIKQVKE